MILKCSIKPNLRVGPFTDTQSFVTLVYLLYHRRGNWISLKLKKLIKSSSREHGPERPPTPTHGVTEPHLSGCDNSSFVSLNVSGGSASTSAGDTASPQRSSSEYDHHDFTKSFPIELAKVVSSVCQNPPFTASATDQEVRSSSEAGRSLCSCKVQLAATGQRNTDEPVAMVVTSACVASPEGQITSQNMRNLLPPLQHFLRRRKKLT